jgi:two-component system, NtrC family, nitrogen regulation sensor histidine kinase NtrY
MIYKRFSFLIIIRIALIIANVLIISVIFGDKRLFFNQIILGLILAIQVGELIRFVNYTNRELSKLFYAIKHSDFSMTFKQPILGKSFKDLRESMIEIIQAYKQVKIEKEAQFHFLQMLVNQLHIGIIAIENNATITLINPTAEQMIGAEGLKNWKLIQQMNPKFSQEVEQLGDHGRKLIELKTTTGESHFTSAAVSTLIILDKPLKLITLQNINSEIEQKEIEAWHKLIRILTHEIMNSVTPISSLTETMESLLQHKDGSEKKLEELKQETISDIRFSLSTIQKRTDGLLQFVDNYRKLTKVPKPALEKTDLKRFIPSVVKLMEQELERKNVSVELQLADSLEVNFDPVLVEQVLINIVTNSIHATAGVAEPKIIIRSHQQEKQVVIAITDNGKGISQKELSEIFIPFFTTKKDGSGIGLSLSKQIMAVHGGSIKVKSELNVGTSVFLHFNR